MHHISYDVTHGVALHIYVYIYKYIIYSILHVGTTTVAVCGPRKMINTVSPAAMEHDIIHLCHGIRISYVLRFIFERNIYVILAYLENKQILPIPKNFKRYSRRNKTLAEIPLAELTMYYRVFFVTPFVSGIQRRSFFLLDVGRF